MSNRFKIIRKYAELRSLEYKKWKHAFERMPEKDKYPFLQEMEEYITAVASGLIIPSKLILPKKPQNASNDTN